MPKPIRSSQCVRVVGELTDSEERPTDRQWRVDGVDPGTVVKPGIDHGGGLVDMASDLGHDAARDVAQVRLVEKGNLGRQDLAIALDVNLVGPVDHDLRDGRVVQEALDRRRSQGRRRPRSGPPGPPRPLTWASSRPAARTERSARPASATPFGRRGCCKTPVRAR